MTMVVRKLELWERWRAMCCLTYISLFAWKNTSVENITYSAKRRTLQGTNPLANEEGDFFAVFSITDCHRFATPFPCKVGIA